MLLTKPLADAGCAFAGDVAARVRSLRALPVQKYKYWTPVVGCPEARRYVAVKNAA
jgi:hypothetical protein